LAGLDDALVELDALKLEKELLALEPAAIAAKVMARFDNAVTRDDDRNRVDVVGLSDGTHGAGGADVLRNAAVCTNMAPGDSP